MTRPFVALFGGTFDPLHVGHLDAAREVRARSGCDRLLLLPASVPPHRPQPEAPAAARLEMVRRAVADEPGLEADGRELERGGPSYTVDTLAAFRGELGDEAALGLVIGADSLAGLDGWDRWERLVDLAHLLVLDRPGSAPPSAGPVAALLAGRAVAGPGALRERPAGALWWVHQRPRDVSATEVRRRLHAGESVEGLIPPAVTQYIRRRGLYAGA